MSVYEYESVANSSITVSPGNKKAVKGSRCGEQKLKQAGYYASSVKQVQVKVSSLILRSGPGTNHSKIGILPGGTRVDVLGKINEWYVIKTADDTVGCVNGSSTYVTPYGADIDAPSPWSDVSNMQSAMLGYINAARTKNSLQSLVLDKTLCNGAYLKSKDMVDNNYFGHNSPVYGTPFNMMKQLNIRFCWAGENLAKHTSIKGAHEGLMNSPSHRDNILKLQYKNLGLGIVKAGNYLYITQWFRG